MFSLIVAGFGTYLVVPTNATIGLKLIAAGIGVACAGVLTTAGSYVCALAAAPYEQRNVLRSELRRAKTAIAMLEAEPVTQAHGDQLRKVALRLRRCIQILEPLDYGPDSTTWCRAFAEHFPALRTILGKISDSLTAGQKLRARLESEAHMAGMDKPPWRYDKFGAGLAWAIEQRSRDGWLQREFDFDWRTWRGSTCAGDPVRGGLEIFTTNGVANPEELKRRFEEFMQAAESWPEAREIGMSRDLLSDLCAAAERLLTNAANTDPIATRCFLCRR
jgi:hypothetical protein